MRYVFILLLNPTLYQQMSTLGFLHQHHRPEEPPDARVSANRMAQLWKPADRAGTKGPWLGSQSGAVADASFASRTCSKVGYRKSRIQSLFLGSNVRFLGSNCTIWNLERVVALILGQIAAKILILMAGGVMPKMVIEVPEEFTERGKELRALADSDRWACNRPYTSPAA